MSVCACMCFDFCNCGLWVVEYNIPVYYCTLLTVWPAKALLDLKYIECYMLCVEVQAIFMVLRLL